MENCVIQMTTQGKAAGFASLDKLSNNTFDSLAEVGEKWEELISFSFSYPRDSPVHFSGFKVCSVEDFNIPPHLLEKYFGFSYIIGREGRTYTDRE